MTQLSPERAAGVPTQSFKKLLRYGFDAVFSFSELPLRLLLLGGCLIAGTRFVIGTIFILRRLLGFEVAAVGFTTLTIATSFLGRRSLNRHWGNWRILRVSLH